MYSQSSDSGSQGGGSQETWGRASTLGDIYTLSERLVPKQYGHFRAV